MFLIQNLEIEGRFNPSRLGLMGFIRACSEVNSLVMWLQVTFVSWNARMPVSLVTEQGVFTLLTVACCVCI